ncbi:MAG: hypothetical protein ACLP7O_00320 [Terracidiphilus sp.]
MTAPLWIGLGFLLLLIIFLMCAFFLRQELSTGQQAILKLLSALCAGFSGGFLAGTALFQLNQTSGPLSYGISGSAGFALFMVVWFFYPAFGIVLPPILNMNIPPDWTFHDAVRAAVLPKGVSELKGFTAEELNAPIESRVLSGTSICDLIDQLRLITVPPNVVRPYDVTQQGTRYYLKVR